MRLSASSRVQRTRPVRVLEFFSFVGFHARSVVRRCAFCSVTSSTAQSLLSLLHVFLGGRFVADWVDSMLGGGAFRFESLEADIVQRRILGDVVVREGASVIELLSSEDELLMIRQDAVDSMLGGGAFRFESLEADIVQCRLLGDVVVREGASVIELFSSEDELLMIRQDAADVDH